MFTKKRIGRKKNPSIRYCNKFNFKYICFEYQNYKISCKYLC